MAENKEEKDFRPARFSCEKPIYINIHSNNWKYWIFNIEIFTYLNKIENGENIYEWINRCL